MLTLGHIWRQAFFAVDCRIRSACSPAGLVSDNLLFEDPMMESAGPAAWRDYSKVVHSTSFMAQCMSIQGMNNFGSVLTSCFSYCSVSLLGELGPLYVVYIPGPALT